MWVVVVLALAVLVPGACSRRGTVNSCGHDVSDVRSTVSAVDVPTGEVRWTASVPAAEGIVVEDPTHARAVARWLDRDTVVDVATGEVVGSVGHGESVALDTATGGLRWRDQLVTPSVESGGLTLMTNVWSEPGEDRPLRFWAEDRSGATVWSVTLADDRRGLSGIPRPLVVGDVAMVSLIVDAPAECVKG